MPEEGAPRPARRPTASLQRAQARKARANVGRSCRRSAARASARDGRSAPKGPCGRPGYNARDRVTEDVLVIPERKDGPP